MASKKAGDPAAKAAKPAQGKGEKADAEMKDTPSAATGDGKKETAPEEDKGAAGALEEDDEFEEFVAEEWNDDDEARDQNLWEDNWDDDDVEDDFSKQLRAELERAHPMKM